MLSVACFNGCVRVLEVCNCGRSLMLHIVIGYKFKHNIPHKCIDAKHFHNTLILGCSENENVVPKLVLMLNMCVICFSKVKKTIYS